MGKISAGVVAFPSHSLFVLSLFSPSCPFRPSLDLDFLVQQVRDFYARKQLLLSARLSHRTSVRLSVCLVVTRVDQAKTVQARITKSSPSAA